MQAPPETRERVRAFDLARGLTVTFMIGAHAPWQRARPRPTGPAGG